MTGKKPCCAKGEVKKGPWTPEEDARLVSYIHANGGHRCWRTLPKLAGLLRCGKSCRLRWTNYLRPDIKRGLFSETEQQMLIDLHEELGNRWSKIAARLPGRTDNEIKNYWNTHIKKRLHKMGVDPATHRKLHENNEDSSSSEFPSHVSDPSETDNSGTSSGHHPDGSSDCGYDEGGSLDPSMAAAAAASAAATTDPQELLMNRFSQLETYYDDDIAWDFMPAAARQVYNCNVGEEDSEFAIFNDLWT